MGKKKDRQVKLPKQVAGVKVPKKLRKIGGKALELAQQPVVSEIAAAALLAAAKALRDGAPAKGSAKAAGNAAGKAAGEAKDKAAEVRREAMKLGDTLRVLAIDLARRTLDSIEEKNGKKGAGTSAEAGGEADAKAADKGAGKG